MEEVINYGVHLNQPAVMKKTSKYGFPVSILIQKWTNDGKYEHPSYLEDDIILSIPVFREKKPTLKNILPSYVESVPLLVRGEQKGYTISKQWRVGDVNNFTFRTATNIPDENIIKKELCIDTYPVDFPCFIVYNISKSMGNLISLKVYNLSENFHIYMVVGVPSNRRLNRIGIIEGQANFLLEIEQCITDIINKFKNDLPNYDK
jgi:hypothetical protein